MKMNEWTRGALAAALAAALAIPPAALLLTVGSAHASGLAAATPSLQVPTASKKVVTSYLKGDAGNSRAYLSTRKVSGVSSSDPKVVSASPLGGYGFGVKVRKAGKAKVTYTVGGSKRTLSFTVRKYSNPVKSFKLGLKDYAAKFKKAKSHNIAKRKANLGRVSVKPAKGWKLKRIYSGYSARNALTVKNGSKVGGAINLCAVLVHKASGLTETVEVRNG